VGGIAFVKHRSLLVRWAGLVKPSNPTSVVQPKLLGKQTSPNLRRVVYWRVFTAIFD
jgi:hypothetical protein